MKQLEITKFDKNKFSKDKNLIYSIKELLALCVFLPNEIKLNNIINCYMYVPNLDLLLLKFGKVLVGIVGIKIKNKKIIIKHITVSPYYRKQGIGREAIKRLILKYNTKMIEVETDSDAVEFYRKIGFTVNEIKYNPHPVPRYLCTLTI